MKKFLAILLAAMMVMAMSVSAFADGTGSTISVSGALAGETYDLYKIFDATQTEDETTISYTIKSTSQWKSLVEAYKQDSKAVFVLTPSASDSSTLVVTLAEDIELDAAAFAKYLSENLTGKKADATKEATANGAEFTNLDLGYFFVTTTTGSLCAIDTNNSTVEIKEKNTYPTLDKIEDKETAAIGDTVTYTITVTDGTGTDKNITVHDKMEAGLTLNIDSFKVDGVEDYTLVTDPTDNCTFEIVFDAADVKDNAAVVITYKATLNKDAEISEETNDNTAWLTYQAQTTDPVTVSVETFEFTLKKTDGTNALDGAKFKLYDAATGGNVIPVVLENGVYRVAVAGETGVEIEAGTVAVKGLDKKSYFLEETEAPAGYNPLTERVEVKAGEKDEITVVNTSGIELPSTGGVGTTMMIAFASFAAMATAVVLVTKKRMYNRG